MAVTGTFSDRFLNLFNENLLNELQQEGSRLINLFPRERMKGQKSYFDKIGVTTSHQKTSRLQDITPDEETYERRLLTFQTHYAAYTPDINDLMDMVADPTSDILRNMGFSLGRKMDEIIMDAIGGTAVVQTNGSTTNTTLPAGQVIAVSDITFDLDLAAGDKGLTPGKLMTAVKLLKQNYAMGDFVVIAPAGQLANVLAHARASSGDYVTARPLESAGFEPALAGYLGLNFVHYEETGVDSNADELVYVVARNAIKVGERQPLMTKLAPRVDKVGHPQQLHSFFDMGATRMFEEAVVQIACDPRKA
jgi:hypothetical protein